jgi:hypothetical protein
MSADVADERICSTFQLRKESKRSNQKTDLFFGLILRLLFDPKMETCVIPKRQQILTRL